MELARQPGVAVAGLAREHGVNANQVFSWRKLHKAGQLAANASEQGSELAPATMATSAQAPETVTVNGLLEIGRTRLRIEGRPLNRVDDFLLPNCAGKLTGA